VVLGGGYGSNGGSSQNFQTDEDSNNTTIFVGGLDASITDEDLRRQFSQFGKIVSVKIPVGKECGFVQFNTKSNADEALLRLNGTTIGKNTVSLSWGHSFVNKQAHTTGQAYDGSYGYAAPVFQNPNMYVTTATAYMGLIQHMVTTNNK
ncbi:hypothetical protein GIB67_016772, partial [Kingdonia uniflora]